MSENLEHSDKGLQLKENLQNAVSLIILLENDIESQTDDEIYPRVLGMVHKLISESIKLIND